ncbi:MAG TPA: class I SAM-dependent methyltransferase [Solirubrobacteraceae bacterium]|jgi:ubiquinone/menaquinone biosynthesis C-methylase UbiE|nr:class I SAM-dependent methyltransferase [Solirubrobacteraceae bacterium]
MDRELEGVLAEQRRYYEQRAGEYEDWWLRRGRYAHGEEADALWFAETAALEAQLERMAPRGEVLELACGTGLWTAALAERAARVTALDAAGPALAIAREKVDADNVEWVQADVFEWEPESSWDVCFFSFWLSHVPRELLPSFMEKVARTLAPDGRALMFDSARSARASARDHDLNPPGEELSRRRLGDGREYTIVKHWYEAGTLQRELEALGWTARIGSTGEFFVYGELSPPRRA